MNSSCPVFLEQFIKNNDFLNQINDTNFNYELKYNNKCCNYD